ncbi:hypothetical protein [Propionivibrio sp.]|uniref:hypothetical protein n=1 Tax=Propionivibrio sp. TaxID=2212460 RepID=UPI003BF3F60F
MSNTTDCKQSGSTDSGIDLLPTRQKNALRLLLNKASFTPEEIAAIDFRVLMRAPGIGKNSITIIRTWLNSHGYEISTLPTTTVNQRSAQRIRKLERAIDYLRWHGYEVRRSN